MKIDEVSVVNLHRRLGFKKQLHYPRESLRKSFSEWKMEIDDAPILRYLYRNFRPKRHLEFGTWEGFGVVLCLEETNATVWTINLLEGEARSDGSWAYGREILESENLPEWVVKLEIKNEDGSSRKFCQTDARGFIGHLYLDRNLGSRVCQIYGDSRDWDITQYPLGFFDTVFIDGGHSKEVVIADTEKALNLVRSGGLIIWHDYCPVETVHVDGSSTIGVRDAIEKHGRILKRKLSDLFWINPSWILIGIKK